MIDLLQTAKDLIKWANTNGSFGDNKWIMGNPNHDHPEYPFGFIIIRMTDRIGEDYISPPDSGTGLRVVTGNRDLSLELQTIGGTYGEAYTGLASLRDSTNLSSVRQLLAKDGLVHVDDQPITDLTGLEDSEMIPRYSMDMTFRKASIQTGIDDSFIDKVLDLNGVLKIGDTTIDDRTFSINN